MSEGRQRHRVFPSEFLSRAEVGFEPYQAERNDYPDVLEVLEFIQQIRAAVLEFRRQWFVARRSAMDCSSDIGIDEFEPVCAICRRGLVCKAEVIQRAK